MHCSGDWGQNWSRAWYLCFRHSSLAWLQVGWDKTFSSAFWHFTSSIPILLLTSVHYSPGDLFTALLLYLTLQGLCFFEFWWYWVIFLQGSYIWSNSKKTSFHLKKKSSIFLKGRSLFELPVLCGGAIKKKKKGCCSLPFPSFFKKDKAAYTSLRKNSQLVTANNYLEIFGYHMRIVGFFFFCKSKHKRFC